VEIRQELCTFFDTNVHHLLELVSRKYPEI